MTFDNDATVTSNLSKKERSPKYWKDAVLQNYYWSYFDNMSSKELDKEFSKDLKTLVNVLHKLDDSERKAFIDMLSRVIQFYFETKIEKEVEQSFFKVFKL